MKETNLKKAAWTSAWTFGILCAINGGIGGFFGGMIIGFFIGTLLYFAAAFLRLAILFAIWAGLLGVAVLLLSN
ncbi:MAG: hypothetical protein WA584_14610 [Pyrinomonadaceae bacterium]